MRVKRELAVGKRRIRKLFLRLQGERPSGRAVFVDEVDSENGLGSYAVGEGGKGELASCARLRGNGYREGGRVVGDTFKRFGSAGDAFLDYVAMLAWLGDL